jgi:hypothetical protein
MHTNTHAPAQKHAAAAPPEGEVLLAPVAPASLQVVMHDVVVKVDVRALHSSKWSGQQHINVSNSSCALAHIINMYGACC